mgnify:CR=1 FL=1
MLFTGMKPLIAFDETFVLILMFFSDIVTRYNGRAQSFNIHFINVSFNTCRRKFLVLARTGDAVLKLETVSANRWFCI